MIFMEQFCIQLMKREEGHTELNYDPNDKKSVENIRDEILQHLKQGWILFGAKKGEELEMICDKSIIDKAPDKNEFVEQKLKDLDRFIMDKDIKKRVLAPTLVSG